MNIVIVGSDELTFNGRVAKTRHLLESRGHEVTVMRLHLGLSVSVKADYGADFQAFAPQPFMSNRNKFLDRFANRRRFRQTLRIAFEYLDSVPADVVHVMDPYALKMADLWASRSGVMPAIIFDACEWFEGTAASDATTARYVRRTLARHGKSLSGWLCPNAALAVLYEHRYPNWPKPHLFGNVPEWQMDRMPARLDSPLRAAIKAKPNEIVLMFSGALNPRRGLEALMAGCHTLPHDAHLVFMGYGALSGLIATQIETQSLQRVHLLPAVPPAALRNWLAGADAGLIPYETGPENHRIATPNKLYEFPGAGVPILASDLPLMRAAIMHDNIGHIANADTLGHNAEHPQADLADLVANASRMRSDSRLGERLQNFVMAAQTDLLSGLTKLYSDLENVPA